MKTLWQQHINQALDNRRQQQALRSRTARQSDTLPPLISHGGKTLLNFGSNDYLGLSRHPDIITAWQQALAEYGCGSTGSPLLCGHTEAHENLESELARWQGYDAALLFAGGFAANQAVLLSLLDKDAVFLGDKLCHASMQEAAALSGALFRRFPHQDYRRLETLLQQYAGRRILVGSEGIFSMDGDSADLCRLQQLCREYGAWLMLDDAHGAGIRGSEGRGSANAAGIKPDILLITFGKAFGCMGSAVLCSRETAVYLTQFARHLVYSTAMPAAQAAALSAALTAVRRADCLRDQLDSNIRLFHRLMRQNGLHNRLIPSASPIQPLICGSNQAALTAAEKMLQQDCYTPAIRPPTVPNAQARLRITLSAAHREAHIIRLCESLHHALR
ncbi:MAG: 8-amino-7-oxononanoate synthase [Neisseria sp.]|nr:8-amino-7-oxononanoate synthase [Neisseria sp.]